MNMFDAKGEIERARSKNPIERIDARISLLRNFPREGDQELKKKIFFELADNVGKNREETVDYVFSIPELNERAYAIMAVNPWLSVDKSKTPPEAGVQKKIRKRFVGGVESLIDDLDTINELGSKLEIAEIIAMEGHFQQALRAVDKTWESGWDVFIPPIYQGSFGIPSTVADNLEKIVKFANLKTVRRKALDCLAEIPDGDKRREYLERAITFEDKDIAVKAVDLFIDKLGEPSTGFTGDKASLAVDAIVARDKLKYSDKVFRTANPAAVKKAFDLYVKLTSEKQRLIGVAGFLDENFSAWMKRRKQDFPSGLIRLARGYLEEHIDGINVLDNKESRVKMLWDLAQYGLEGTDLKAIDYLAETVPLEDGIKYVAQMYSSNNLCHLDLKGQDRVKEWAIKFTRKFIPCLGDCDETRNALGMIRGGKDHHFKGYYCGGDGEFKEDKLTGKTYSEIAAEELAKLPKPPTEEDKIADVFGVS